MRRVLLLLCFLLSGATALCYEVAWTRHLVLVFGNTTVAVSLILAAYMLGLALGAEAGGRLADRVGRPVALYAAAEALIGLYAFAFGPLVAWVRTAYVALGTAAAPVVLAGAFLLLLLPTFLMGATFPLLVRAVVADPERTGRWVGLLYGTNILGAVAGTALTGFVLMEAAGVLGATHVAGIANLGIAGLALLVAGRVAAPTAPRDAAPAAESRAPGSPRAARAALLAVFTAGFVGLAAQVLWTRLLTFFLQGFTYTFSAMLATFLLGLAAGGIVFGRLSTRSSRGPLALLGGLQIGIAVACALTFGLLVRHREVVSDLWGAAGVVTRELRPRHVVFLVLGSLTVLLLPAFLMGGVFPVAAAAYRRGLGDLGARTGRLYAVNTLGAVLGALVAGFVLVPTIGAPWGAALIGVVSLLSGAAVLLLAEVRSRVPWGLAATAGAATFVLPVLGVPGRPFLLNSHVFAGDRAREVRLLEARNGVVATVSVVENEREGYRLLYTDEFEAAGTKPEYRYMRMLAHLPVALSPDPSRVLVICWGTGTTAGSVGTHDAVRRLDIVEISPEVLEAAHWFEDVNRGVLGGRPGLDVRVHVDDGRNFVLRSREQWDVLSLEPLMPYTPAAIHFYTSDFYAEARERLAPHGLLCQWIPLQGMSGEHFRQLVRSFVDVFPDSALFFVDGAAALVGGPDGVVLDHARVAERLAAPRVRADLAEVGFDDPVRALATVIATGERLREFAAGAEPVTDERPVLEFHPIPPNVVLKHLWENLRHVRDLREPVERLPVDTSGTADADAVEERLYLALRSGNAVLDGLVLVEEAALLKRIGRSEEAVTQLAAAREAFRRAYTLDRGSATARRAYEGLEREWHTLLGSSALARGELEEAVLELRRATRFEAQRQADVAWTWLAEALNRSERFEEALEAALEATRRFPRGREPLAERAHARAALGDLEGAAADYRAALGGEDVDVLPPRLRHDAWRVLDAAPTGAPAAPLPERIRAALAGEGVERVPARLRLRLLEAEAPASYAAYFDGLAGSDPAAEDAPERLRRLAAGVPRTAAEEASRWLRRADLPPARSRLAAETLAGADAGALVAALASDLAPGPLSAVAAASARVRDPRVVEALLPLLEHPGEEVRTAAHRALVLLTSGRADGLARMDPAAAGSPDYRRALGDLRAWWARNGEAFDPER